MTQPELDLEELAAFIDGKLTGEARARMVNLLSESEEAFQVFTETLRSQANGDPQIVPLVPKRGSPTNRQWRIVAAVAASIVATVVGANLVIRNLNQAAPNLTDVIALVPVGDSLYYAAWDQPGWAVTRGAATGLTEEQVAFRLGLRIADLGVAVRSNATMTVQLVAAEQVVLLEAVAFSELERFTIQEFQNTADRGVPTDSLLQALEVVRQQQSALVLADPYSFGLWCGTARLAVAADDIGFFSSSVSRRMLSARPWSSLGADAQAAMLQVTALLAGGVSADEVEPLKSALTDVIAASGG